jgi:hypothetical protein
MSDTRSKINSENNSLQDELTRKATEQVQEYYLNNREQLREQIIKDKIARPEDADEFLEKAKSTAILHRIGQFKENLTNIVAQKTLAAVLENTNDKKNNNSK